jgi:hypothetical protein
LHKVNNQRSNASLLAKVLSGAWRNDQADFDISEDELALLNPLLQGSGAGGLGWWRIRNVNLETLPTGEQLLASYRLQTLQAARHKLNIQAIFTLMNAAGIEPILVKGWASARLYPAEGLRPYGDVDLVLRPQDLEKAKAVMNSPAGRKYWVDFEHEDLEKLDEQSVDALFAQSKKIKLGDTQVRVMGEEDHLRFLCIHLLRHGAWRPLWLCDIAAAVESRKTDFDWQRCFGSAEKQADWVLSTIRLAHELLGADIKDTPAENKTLPKWLVPTVLKQWEQPCSAAHRPPELIMTTLRHPQRIPQAIRERWPDPISASIRMNVPFNELPRLPFQVANYIVSLTRFITRLPKLLHRTSQSI